ncbi:MAG: SGNH/GDSL hydrolase family protein [Bacteroidota bacterium]
MSLPVSALPPGSGLHRVLLMLVAFSVVVGCQETSRIVADTETGSILAIGDSVMEWNAEDEASIPDVIAAELGRVVVNGGVSGARLSVPDDEAELGALGYDIREQYRARGWTWVVMDGGANDLGDECGCGSCEATLNEMVSADGQAGQYPDFVRSVVGDSSRVLVMGYYAPPAGAETEFTACLDELDALNARLTQMAAAIEGVHYASAAEVIDPADAASYDPDQVHPSVKGSRLIGERLAQAILDAEREP